jgi:hypothetical protein
VSPATVASSDADSTSVFPAAGADPIARFYQRLAAEQALTELERAVQRLAHRFDSSISAPRCPERPRSR